MFLVALELGAVVERRRPTRTLAHAHFAAKQSTTMRLTSLSRVDSSSRMLDSAINFLTGKCVLAGVGIRCRSRSLNVNIGHELSVNKALPNWLSSMYVSVNLAQVTNSDGAELTAC